MLISELQQQIQDAFDEVGLPIEVYYNAISQSFMLSIHWTDGGESYYISDWIYHANNTTQRPVTWRIGAQILNLQQLVQQCWQVQQQLKLV